MHPYDTPEFQARVTAMADQNLAAIRDTQEPHESGLTCTHNLRGLCDDCRRDYDADPQAWVEFGDHPAGIARWDAEREQIDRDMTGNKSPEYGPEIPL